MPSEMKNVRVKNYIEELQDTIDSDSKVVANLFIFLAVGTTKLTASTLGFCIGGIQGCLQAQKTHAPIVNGFKLGAAEGQSRWSHAVKKYNSVAEVGAGVTGALLGTLGGTLHGSGKFFINKCKSSRPQLKASQNFVELANEEEQQPMIRTGRYVQ